VGQACDAPSWTLCWWCTLRIFWCTLGCTVHTSWRVLTCRVTQKKMVITKNRITSKILFRLTQKLSYIRSSLCSRHLQSFKSVLQKLFVSLALKKCAPMSSPALQAHLDPAGKVLNYRPRTKMVQWCHVWRWQPRQCTLQSVMAFADSAQGMCYPRRCCS